MRVKKGAKGGSGGVEESSLVVGASWVAWESCELSLGSEGGRREECDNRGEVCWLFEDLMKEGGRDILGGCVGAVSLERAVLSLSLYQEMH